MAECPRVFFQRGPAMDTKSKQPFVIATVGDLRGALREMDVDDDTPVVVLVDAEQRPLPPGIGMPCILGAIERVSEGDRGLCIKCKRIG